MGGFARRVVPALEGQQHCAVLDVEGERRVLDVWPLPAYAKLPIKAAVLSGMRTAEPVRNQFSERGGFAGGSGQFRHPAEPVQQGGSGQSDGVDREAVEPVPNQFTEPAEPVPNQATILAAYQRLGSKNKVFEWMREHYGIANKPTALRLIDAAIADHPGNDQADDDDPPPAFGWLTT
jgi:hypothetical protein